MFINLYSDKNRVPSWTDRILFSGAKFVGLKYGRIEIDSSDHKPVFLSGTLEVISIVYTVVYRII